MYITLLNLLQNLNPFWHHIVLLMMKGLLGCKIPFCLTSQNGKLLLRIDLVDHTHRLKNQKCSYLGKRMNRYVSPPIPL